MNASKTRKYFLELKSFAEQINYLVVNLANDALDTQVYISTVEKNTTKYESVGLHEKFVINDTLQPLLRDIYGSIMLSCNLFGDYLKKIYTKGSNKYEMKELDSKSSYIFKALFPFASFLLQLDLFMDCVLISSETLLKPEVELCFQNMELILQSFIIHITRGDLWLITDVDSVLGETVIRVKDPDNKKLSFIHGTTFYCDLIKNYYWLLTVKFNMNSWDRIVIK